jgi:hypothetical protein
MIQRAYDMGFTYLSERPILEVGPLQQFFANGICGLELLGSRSDVVKITYYQDGKTRLDGESRDKVPVFEVIIPLADLILTRTEISARMAGFKIDWNGTADDCHS